jgi:hypothetical protein
MKKNRIDKDYSAKKKKKIIKKEKKNHMGKHCSNPQCFKEKTTKINSQLARY